MDEIRIGMCKIDAIITCGDGGGGGGGGYFGPSIATHKFIMVMWMIPRRHYY